MKGKPTDKQFADQLLMQEFRPTPEAGEHALHLWKQCEVRLNELAARLDAGGVEALGQREHYEYLRLIKAVRKGETALRRRGLLPLDPDQAEIPQAGP